MLESWAGYSRGPSHMLVSKKTMANTRLKICFEGPKVLTDAFFFVLYNISEILAAYFLEKQLHNLKTTNAND